MNEQEVVECFFLIDGDPDGEFRPISPYPNLEMASEYATQLNESSLIPRFHVVPAKIVRWVLASDNAQEDI